MRKSDITICTFDGCERRASGCGLCPPHGRQRNAGMSLRPLRIRARMIRPPCAAEGCAETSRHVGLCIGHYIQRKRRQTIRPLGLQRVRGLAALAWLDALIGGPWPNDCAEWPGRRDKDGYGVLKIDGRYDTAHRLAFKRSKGEIGSGLCVCHSCDNPSCCNPAHLWAGTPKDNNDDAISKGRKPKITQEQRASIRAALDAGMRVSRVARQLGISDASVSRVKSGRSRRS